MQCALACGRVDRRNRDRPLRRELSRCVIPQWPVPLDGFANMPSARALPSIHICQRPGHLRDAVRRTHTAAASQVLGHDLIGAGFHGVLLHRGRTNAGVGHAPSVHRPFACIQDPGSYLSTGFTALSATDGLQTYAEIDSVEKWARYPLRVGLDRRVGTVAVPTEAARGMSISAWTRISREHQLKIRWHFPAPAGAVQADGLTFQRLAQ